MAGEYRVSATALEVLGDGASMARASALGLEALQADDAATRARVSLIGLEVLRTPDDAPTQDAAVTFAVAGTLGLAGPSLIAGGRLNFAVALGLAFLGEKDPPFDCAPPPAKAWARAAVDAADWACAAVEPPQHCDETGADAAPVLTFVDGAALTDVAGRRLKLIAP